MAGSGSKRIKKKAGKERGESSTQQERLHTYDYERFSCVGAARWYDDNIKRKIVCEKKISEEIEGDLHIGDFFDFYGWRNIITIGGGYDPEIVRDFYAHMDMEPVTNNRRDSLGSCIRGMVVEITTEDIATFLGMGEVQKGGNLLKFKGNGAPTNETNFDYSRAYQVLGVDRSEERGVVYARFLQVSHRLVAYFIRHNIMPSSGSTNEVRLSDMYLLYHMVDKPEAFVPYNLLESIVCCIKDTRDDDVHMRALVFPTLIYHCLRMKYPIIDEIAGDLVDVNNLVTKNTLSKLHIVRLGGVWYYRDVAPPLERRPRGRPRHDADQQPGPGFVSLEVFHATMDSQSEQIRRLYEQREEEQRQRALELEELKRLRELLEHQGSSRRTGTDASVGGSSGASASGAHMDISGVRGEDAHDEDD